MHRKNRKHDRAETLQRRMARELKYAGLVEYGVDLEVAISEHRVAVAELTGGARNV